jgi:hypothetical protein
MDIFYLALILVSLVMGFMGGLSDITGKRFLASKEHYWRDSMYILILVIALHTLGFRVPKNLFV